jgi:hypothetical protein
LPAHDPDGQRLTLSSIWIVHQGKRAANFDRAASPPLQHVGVVAEGDVDAAMHLPRPAWLAEFWRYRPAASCALIKLFLPGKRQ